MTERDTVRLLRAIKDLAVLGYPYERDAVPIDNALVLCLGQIAALASKALAEYGTALDQRL
jgi:hypothetical protein